VTDAFRILSDDEVRQIALIIESLDRSTFDFLQLEFGDVKLTIGKGQPPPLTGTAPHVPTASPPVVPQMPSDSVAAPAAPAQPVAAFPAAGEQSDDTIAIVAPLLGRFYAQPEPGAPPFVAIGSQVTEATTVGLIEVMKTFNAVSAGVSGVITEICVQEAQIVEYGQVLFRVRPIGKP